MNTSKFFLMLISLTWLITNAADCGGGGNPEPTVCTDANTVKFPQDAVDRFYFKKGSYWVYTDSTTQTMYDSLWVYHNTWNSTSKKEDGHYKDKCYEFGYILLKTINGLHYNEGLLPMFSLESELIDYSQEVFRVEISDIINGTATMTRLLLQGNDYDTRFTGEVSLQDSIEINSNVYKDILKLHYPGQHSDFLNDGYWAKHVGLIKFTDTNGTVWQLVKSKTIQ